MGVQDVLRDTGTTHLADQVNNEQDRKAFVEKYKDLPDADLWKLHTTWGTFNAQGAAVLELLKARCPEQFKK